jgi:hypothetical protein
MAIDLLALFSLLFEVSGIVAHGILHNTTFA